jgi:hypothetical protein
MAQIFVAFSEKPNFTYLVFITLPAVLQATDFADLADLVDFALPCLLRPDFVVFALPPLSLSLFSCKKIKKFLIAKWNPDLRKPDLRKNLDLRKIVGTTDFLVHKLFGFGF